MGVGTVEILYIVVACLAFLSVVLGLAVYWFERKKRRRPGMMGGYDDVEQDDIATPETHASAVDFSKVNIAMPGYKRMEGCEGSRRSKAHSEGDGSHHKSPKDDSRLESTEKL